MGSGTVFSHHGVRGSVTVCNHTHTCCAKKASFQPGLTAAADGGASSTTPGSSLSSHRIPLTRPTILARWATAEDAAIAVRATAAPANHYTANAFRLRVALPMPLRYLAFKQEVLNGCTVLVFRGRAASPGRALACCARAPRYNGNNNPTSNGQVPPRWVRLGLKSA